MIVILYVAVTVVSLMIIGLVLIQQSKGGGLGASFGGGGDSVLGAQATGHLTKLTVILVTVFFSLVLLLAVLSGRDETAASLIADEAVVVEEPVAVEVSASPEQLGSGLETAVEAVQDTAKDIAPKK